MKKDEVFERVVQIVQKSIENIPEKEVIHQYKVPSVSGRLREIDVYIEMVVNDELLKIAIECKDCKRRVSVDKIEAFHSKCLRIPGINRKMFVTRLGYQAEAIHAAKDFGIDLFLLKELEQSAIQDWLGMPMIKRVRLEKRLIGLAFEFFEDPKMDFSGIDVLKFEGISTEISVKDFLLNRINEEFQFVVLNFTANNDKLSFSIQFDMTNTAIEKNEVKYPIKRLYTTLEIVRVKIKDKTYFNQFYSFDKNDETTLVATSIGEDDKLLSIVKTDNEEEFNVFNDDENAEFLKNMRIRIEKNKEEKNGS